MNAAAQLAGFYAAHAIWCVSDGETLIPMLARLEGDEAVMERLEEDDFTDSVAAGRERLASEDGTAAALLYDAAVEIEDQSVDAIVIEVRSGASPEAEIVLAVAYTPAQPGPFAVHRPKVLAWTNCEEIDLEEFLTSFYQGVDGHEQGAKIWNQHLDESR